MDAEALGSTDRETERRRLDVLLSLGLVEDAARMSYTPQTRSTTAACAPSTMTAARETAASAVTLPALHLHSPFRSTAYAPCDSQAPLWLASGRCSFGEHSASLRNVCVPMKH